MREVLDLLRDSSPAADDRWRVLSRALFHRHSSVGQLMDWFKAICAFDSVFLSCLANPVRSIEGAVLVAGSGKESFKTFNVTTAAALIAAAAGVPVVKG